MGCDKRWEAVTKEDSRKAEGTTPQDFLAGKRHWRALLDLPHCCILTSPAWRQERGFWHKQTKTLAVWSLLCLICCLCIRAALWSSVCWLPPRLCTNVTWWDRNTLPALPCARGARVSPLPWKPFREAVKSGITLPPALSTVINSFPARTKCQGRQSW